MQAYFWGTRGSLPTSTTSRSIEARIFKAIKAARLHELSTDVAILDFIHNELPFADRGGYGGNTACVEITGQNDYVLCDAGTGLRDFGSYYMRSVAKGEKKLSRVFHIFMSHMHWDHIQGFPFFTPAYIPGHHIHIYGYHSELERSFVRQQEAVSFPISLKAMGADIFFHVLEPERTYEIAGLTVTGIKQRHPGDSYGYSFCKDGKKMVYSTDSEHNEDWENDGYPFIPFFDKADLLIFDAQYGLLAAIDARKSWGHSSNLLGVEMAIRAGVKHLCLFHNEHTSDDTMLDQYLLDTRKYLNIHDSTSRMMVSLAYDGLAVNL